MRIIPARFKSLNSKTYSFLFLVIAFVLTASCNSDEFDTIILAENAFTRDNNMPVPGSSGIISTSAITDEGLQLSWTKATDRLTPQTDLEYRVYSSESNNISTPVDAETFGTPLQAWLKDNYSLLATGLDPSKTYYFNVVVRASDGRKSAYVTTTATTLGTIYLYSVGPFAGDLTVTDTRTDADALCSTIPVTGPTHWRAFISINADDSISGFPSNYSVPVGLPVRSTSKSLIAMNWADLLNGTINYSLDEAGVSKTQWWSGSDSNGNIDTSANCNGWTSSLSTSSGRTGAPNLKDENWIKNINNNCDTPQKILCIAW